MVVPDVGSLLSVCYITGSSISILSSIFVIFSTLKFPVLWRQHPSSLIFWRSLFDLVFSSQFLVMLWDGGKANCQVFSPLVQFALLGSQSWYGVIALDTYLALKNPFSDPKSNLMPYHVFVWMSSAISSMILISTGKTAWRNGMRICWIQPTTEVGSVNFLSWAFFYFPTIFYYVLSLLVMVFAFYRLSKGLKETFKIRTRVLWNGARYTAGYFFYWTLAGVIYFLIYLRSREDPQQELNPDLKLYVPFAVSVTFRGVIDLCIWMYNHEVVKLYQIWWTTRHISTKEKTPLQQGADINHALRKEVLKFCTLGIYRSVNKGRKTPSLKSIIPETAQRYFPREITTLKSAPPKKQQRDRKQQRENTPMPESQDVYFDWLKRDEDDEKTQEVVPFASYAPQIFRYLRHYAGISEEEYVTSIRGNTDVMVEKFTEGRSGSFFYFSEDGKYMIKTLTKREALFLLSFLPHYARYLTTNPDSLLVKFLGFYSIKLYTVTLYLVAMQSIFLTKKLLHERYDLKGSWIDRHVSGRGKKRRGDLKDSDLNTTLLLSEEKRTLFLSQVEKDAKFLESNNIMDYSLLLGIHKVRHEVYTDIPPTTAPTPYATDESGVTRHSTLFRGRVPSVTTPAASLGNDGPLSQSESVESFSVDPTPKTHSFNQLGQLGAFGGGFGGERGGLVGGLGSGGGGGIGGGHLGRDASLFPSASGVISVAASASLSSQRQSSFQREGEEKREARRLPSGKSYNNNLPFFQSEEGGIRATIVEGPGLYFMGIIDILQEYNTKKQLERFAKVYLRCKDPLGISAVEPHYYRSRFVKAMHSLTEADETSQQDPHRPQIARKLSPAREMERDSKESTPKQSEGLSRFKTTLSNLGPHINNNLNEVSIDLHEVPFEPPTVDPAHRDPTIRNDNETDDRKQSVSLQKIPHLSVSSGSNSPVFNSSPKSGGEGGGVLNNDEEMVSGVGMIQQVTLDDSNQNQEGQEVLLNTNIPSDRDV